MTPTIHPSEPSGRAATIVRIVVVAAAVLATVATGLAAPAGARADLGPTRPAGATDAVEVDPGPALTGVRSVVTGQYQSCALLESGRVRCWGHNEAGTLGNGTRTNRPAAVTVLDPTGTGPLTGVAALAAGSLHTCALLASREVRCWGDNAFGQLGSGSTEPRSLLPVAVSNESGESTLQGVAQITAGGNNTCARLVSGQVRCWGDNRYQQLGDGGITPSSLPVAVSSVGGGSPLTGVTQVDSGEAHACARLTTGGAVCWGENLRGLLGDGTRTTPPRPVPVVNGSGTSPLTGIRRVSAGGTFTCALLVDRTARCWGDGQYGQIGDGQTDDRLRPTLVRTGPAGPPLRGIATLEAAWGHACARSTDGQVRCWGDNSYHQLGNGTPSGPNVASPRPVRAVTGAGALTGVTQLHTSAGHTCVRLASGRALCWGYGEQGQLGDGRTANRSRPVTVRTAVD